MTRPKKVPVFSRMGAVYHLLADEKSRAMQEKPLLLELAAQAMRSAEAMPQPKAERPGLVLDLACGTGLHARIFGRAGYRVLALDLSDSMLRQARSLRNPPCITYAKADLLRPLPTPEQAALALLLGNTLCVFREREKLLRAFRNTAAATLPGGLVFVQTLNYHRLRRLRTVLTLREGNIEGVPVVVTKTLHFVGKDRLLLNISACRSSGGDGWESFSECQLLRPWAPEDLTTAAGKAGLRLREEFGSDAKEPYDPESSGIHLAVFEKIRE